MVSSSRVGLTGCCNNIVHGCSSKLECTLVHVTDLQNASMFGDGSVRMQLSRECDVASGVLLCIVLASAAVRVDVYACGNYMAILVGCQYVHVCDDCV